MQVGDTKGHMRGGEGTVGCRDVREGAGETRMGKCRWVQRQKEIEFDWKTNVSNQMVRVKGLNYIKSVQFIQHHIMI